MTDLKQKFKEAILPPPLVVDDTAEKFNDRFRDGFMLACNAVVRNIDKLLEGANVVKGWASNGEWFESPQALPEYPSHQALLIMIEPIKKPKVTREEIVEFLDAINGRVKDNLMDQKLTELARRIKEEGIE